MTFYVSLVTFLFQLWFLSANLRFFILTAKLISKNIRANGEYLQGKHLGRRMGQGSYAFAVKQYNDGKTKSPVLNLSLGS